MPSFVFTSLFLWQTLCIPTCILVLSATALAHLGSVRLRSILLAVFLSVFALVFFRTHSHQFRKLEPAFAQVLDSTRYTSAMDKLYVPSHGNRLVSIPEPELALSMTYFFLGLQRYQIQMADSVVVHALVPAGLSPNAVSDQIHSEALLLAPVSLSHFTPQGLKQAQNAAKTHRAQDLAAWTATIAALQSAWKYSVYVLGGLVGSLMLVDWLRRKRSHGKVFSGDFFVQ